ncbi:unnamed protein product [Cylindrotheca closterium]|uniref:RCC1-like domain-containing protein n=1 Tax=Cylindrotheca closterium TaxID=2856 RepID=A0AAD2GBZ7_9STRA|nr:unnamed protein product [Cylindrotheca closterium]
MMSSSKKRSATDGGFSQGDDDSEMKARKQRVKVSSPSKKSLQNSQFLDDKKSLWQQAMEQLNEQTKKVLNRAKTDDDVFFACMEYTRHRDWITQRYNPACGRVVSMGSDDCNQLGVAASADADKECEYPPTFVNLDGSKVAHVAGGGLHSLVLTVDGKVYSFGNNDDNALGRGEIHEDRLHLAEPIKEGFRPDDRNRIVGIDAGDSHSLFLSILGNVYQSGMYKDVDSGKFHDVPIGTNESPKGSNVYPTLVDLPGPVREIKAGEAFNAALLEDGNLYTWGMGHFGQLARSKTMGADLKKDEKGNSIPGVYELGKMWIGEEYETDEQEKDGDGNLKFDEKGNPVWATAYRYHEDLIKEKFLKPAPVIWANPYPKRSVLSLACGELFILVVARDEGYDTNVYSAGHNGFGQLGHGDKHERHELTPIKFFERKLIKKVSAGTSHGLALDMAGNAVFAWGRSDYGQLGHTDDIKGGDIEMSPQQIAFPESLGSTRIRDIAAGSSISMAITEENDVYTWGFGETCATGHLASAEDIKRPKKLDVLRQALKRGGAKSKNCHVLEGTGGAQHSLMILECFS